MAGALSYSGHHVPKAIKGNATNPQGFFEPRWVVNFHKRLLKTAGVGTLDADPAALDHVREVAGRKKPRTELREWLETEFEAHPRLVLKDPRMVWFRDLWVETAQGLGVEPAFVIMLRHPSEVSASRSTYYQARDVGAVGGWINVALTSESLTAESPRSLVHYPDLLTDWRAQMTGLRDHLGLTLDPGPEVTPHPVDDFIDPALRRMSSGWEDIAVPAHLSDLADRVFTVLHRIATTGDSPESAVELAGLRQEYADTYEAAMTLVKSTRQRRETQVRRRTAEKVRKQMAAKRAATDDVEARTDNPNVLRTVVRRLSDRVRG